MRSANRQAFSIGEAPPAALPTLPTPGSRTSVRATFDLVEAVDRLTGRPFRGHGAVRV